MRTEVAKLGQSADEQVLVWSRNLELARSNRQTRRRARLFVPQQKAVEFCAEQLSRAKKAQDDLAAYVEAGL